MVVGKTIQVVGRRRRGIQLGAYARGRRRYFRWWWLIRDLDVRYNPYVEFLEPAGGRAFDPGDDPDDCPTHESVCSIHFEAEIGVEPTRSLLLLKKDTEGCPKIIPGGYFDFE